MPNWVAVGRSSLPAAVTYDIGIARIYVRIRLDLRSRDLDMRVADELVLPLIPTPFERVFELDVGGK